MVAEYLKEHVVGLAHRHGALVLVQTLVAVANTLANSFALIYLIREGYDYIECSVFVLISVAVPMTLAAFASRTVVKNFPASITTGLTCLALYYLGLYALDGWLLVIIPPIFFGTYIVTFWVPYNALVMHVTSKKKRGAVIGIYFLIFPLVTTVAPLVGGIIITVFSYQALFALGAAVVFLDLLYVSGFKVLAKIRERIIIPELLRSLKVNLVGKMQIDLDLKGLSKRLMMALFAEGFQDGIFWVAVPIISFEFATDELELSGYLSLFALWGAVMTVGLGYLSDKVRNREVIVRAGALLAAVSLLVVAMAPNAHAYLVGMSATFFFLAIIPSFLFTMLLDEMAQHKKKGVLLREFLLNAGRTCGVAVVVAVMLVSTDLSITLVVAALALASIAMVKKGSGVKV